MSLFESATFIEPITICHEGKEYQGLPLPEDIEPDASGMVFTVVPTDKYDRCASGTGCACAPGHSNRSPDYKIMWRSGGNRARNLPYCEACLIGRHGAGRGQLPDWPFAKDER